jgi:hypothetical protein
MGFWHNFQGGQSTWSCRILKAIMEKQQADAPTPHDPARMKKDIDEYPQFPMNTLNGHAAWTEWPWKLHRISEKKRTEVRTLQPRRGSHGSQRHAFQPGTGATGKKNETGAAIMDRVGDKQHQRQGLSLVREDHCYAMFLTPDSMTE